MVHYTRPTLLRHGEVWVFHFPGQRQVHIRCPRDHEWVTRTQILSGAGLIQNATGCTITTGEIRTLPELHGVAHASLVAPSVYVPDISPVLAKHELPVWKRRSRQGSTAWIWLRTVSSPNRSGSMWTRSISRGPPLARNIARPGYGDLCSLRRARSIAGAGDVSTHETPACCLMLPAHQRVHRRQYTPVPGTPCFGSSSPDGQRICRATR